MLIAMHTEVECIDGMAGHCSHVIVEPKELKVTHLVIGANERPPRPQRPPRLVVEETEKEIMLKRPRLVVEENRDPASPRPPRLVVEEEERRVTLTAPRLEVEEDESWDTQRLVPWDRVADATIQGITLDCTEQELAAMQDFIERHYVRVAVPDYRNGSELMLLGGKMPEEIKWAPVEEERVPENEFALSRRTRVEATDGEVGRLGPLEVEPGSGRITHLVLNNGQPWDRKGVAVPASFVERLGEGTVHLKLDRQSVKALPGL
ncbi:hypothetical protein [Candidatus Amarolinea aalborgensis]|uniref:hypothetical protein n=1 Tax=Candidatus Amarolinea aalborgensis TaxID=2249329 RepID=UPI003BF9949A